MEENKEIETLEESVVEKKKKGNTGLIVVIVLLLLICCGLGGFIFVNKDKIFNKTTGPESGDKEKKETKEEDLSLTDERFIKIYNALKTYTYESGRENGYKGFTDLELGYIGTNDLTQGDFTKTDEVSQWGDSFYTFSSDRLIENLKKYFSDDVTLDFDNLVKENQATYLPQADFGGSGMTIYAYDKNTKLFKVRFGGIGGSTGPVPNIQERAIVSAKLVGDTITVEEKAIYYYAGGDYTEMIYNIYGNPSKQKVIDTKTFNADTVMNETISVDSYLDQASTITHTFKAKKDGENYYFQSSNIK